MKELEILKEIAEKINAKGGKLYGVGGYVRDKFTQKLNKDIDVEVFGLSPADLKEILSEYGVVNEVGASFGVYLIHGLDIDFALPRKEVKAKVINDDSMIFIPSTLNQEMTQLIQDKYPSYSIEVNENEVYSHRDFIVIPNPYLSLKEATIRRDFTMNALMEDLMTGEIIDLWNGRADIENKVIRHINDKTFKEDSLRVLRACQFASRFDFSIHPETINLCQSIQLNNLPKERIFTELEKALMKSDKPSIALEYLKELNVIQQLFPELEALTVCMQDSKHHPEGSVWNHTKMVLDVGATLKGKASNPLEFMFGLLLHDIGKPATSAIRNDKITFYEHEDVGAELSIQFMKKLTTNKKLIEGVHHIVKNHMRLKALYPNGGNKAFRKLAFQTNIQDIRLVTEADYLGRGFENQDFSLISEWFENRMNELGTNTKIVPVVTGKDLIARGLTPGVEFKIILDKALNLQLEGYSKEDIMRRLFS